MCPSDKIPVKEETVRTVKLYFQVRGIQNIISGSAMETWNLAVSA